MDSLIRQDCTLLTKPRRDRVYSDVAASRFETSCFRDSYDSVLSSCVARCAGSGLNRVDRRGVDDRALLRNSSCLAVVTRGQSQDTVASIAFGKLTPPLSSASSFASTHACSRAILR